MNKSDNDNREPATEVDDFSDLYVSQEADDDAVFELLLRELDGGPLTIDQLADAVLAEGLIDGNGHARDHDLATDVISDLILFENQVWERDGLVARCDRLLDGRIFTRRLTAEEVAHDVLTLDGDLCVVDVDLDSLVLVSGETIEVTHEVPRGWHGLAGPAGWLAGLSEGDVVGLRRCGPHVQLEVVPHPEAGAAEVAAVLEEMRSVLGAGAGDELTQHVLNALIEDSELFRQPVLPLSELLVQAGLTQDGPFFGPGDQLWHRHGFAVAFTRRLVGAQYNLDECCHRALDVVFDGWRANVLGATGLSDAPSEASVATALAHGQVAGAFVGHADGPETGEQLAAFVRSLVSAAPNEAGPIQLAGCMAERRGDLEQAEHHYRRAIEVDPLTIPALLALGWIEYDRSNFAAAARLFRRVWAPDHSNVVAAEGLAAALLTAGRNHPCPCGSGRKYKTCHSGQILTDPERRSSIVIGKLARFATSPGQMLSMVALAQKVDLDVVTLYTNRFLLESCLLSHQIAGGYQSTRGSLLPPDEAELLSRMIGLELLMVEVDGTAVGSSVILRNLLTDERFDAQLPASTEHPPSGEVVLARVLDGRLIGNLFRLRPDHHRSARDLVSRSPHLNDILEWYVTEVDQDHPGDGGDEMVIEVAADSVNLADARG